MHQTTKRHTLTPNLVEQFVWCGSSVVLTLDDGEKKKYARIAIGKSMSSITLRPLPRRRDLHAVNTADLIATVSDTFMANTYIL